MKEEEEEGKTGREKRREEKKRREERTSENIIVEASRAVCVCRRATSVYPSVYDEDGVMCWDRCSSLPSRFDQLVFLLFFKVINEK